MSDGNYCAVIDVLTSGTIVMTYMAAANASASALAVGVALAQELGSERSIGSRMVLHTASAPLMLSPQRSPLEFGDARP